MSGYIVREHNRLNGTYVVEIWVLGPPVRVPTQVELGEQRGQQN